MPTIEVAALHKIALPHLEVEKARVEADLTVAVEAPKRFSIVDLVMSPVAQRAITAITALDLKVQDLMEVTLLDLVKERSTLRVQLLPRQREFPLVTLRAQTKEKLIVMIAIP